MDCIFCNIVGGKFGTEILAQNETAIAFRDINPLAKVHILVVPKQHTATISSVPEDRDLVGLFSLIREVSAKFTDGQFRLQFNSGEKEGQTVFHTHAHILSGRAV